MGKSKQKICNWKPYKQALVNRGYLSFWMSKPSNNGIARLTTVVGGGVTSATELLRPC